MAGEEFLPAGVPGDGEVLELLLREVEAVELRRGAAPVGRRQRHEQLAEVHAAAQDAQVARGGEEDLRRSYTGEREQLRVRWDGDDLPRSDCVLRVQL